MRRILDVELCLWLDRLAWLIHIWLVMLRLEGY